ncbi:hypothetical protein KL86DYS1_30174 [uncultured Dysgonomonas sp.]|uniref:Uncharacterized protein n=1 Tax=uncultured Dysgonomonas sp. TaxID=206096 RepID=A0A212JRU1_9BACT|nr:hypothetical protein KL86DYS1_30174 [uncultured Dysgonomonas sp.]
MQPLQTPVMGITGIIPKKHEQKNAETDCGHARDINHFIWLFLR